MGQEWRMEMSVMIKVLDMPETCDKCDIEAWIPDDKFCACTRKETDRNFDRTKFRHPDCPFVKVEEDKNISNC